MSESKPDGGPAFPHFTRHTIADSGLVVEGTVPGMTLRDWFAGQALMGILAFPGAVSGDRDKTKGRVATAAYTYADAMLAARSE